MHIPLALSLVLVLLFTENQTFANDYLLHFEEVKGDSTILRSLETNVTLGKPFYIRSVSGTFQWLLRGTLEGNANELSLKHRFEGTELGEDPASRIRLVGTVELELWKEITIGETDNDREAQPRPKVVLRLMPFVPEFGFKDASSGFSVKLVDDTGQPVAKAKTGLFGPLGDSPWECIIGLAESDAHGVVRISEGRESLPDLTFFAEHAARKIFAAANLDRSHVKGAGYGDGMPVKVTMSEKSKRWKRPELPITLTAE